MRLTQEQTHPVARIIHRHTDEGAEIFLFGSSLNDSARREDVDLLPGTSIPHVFIQRAQIKMELVAKRGLSVNIRPANAWRAPEPFLAIAKAGAARLDAPATLAATVSPAEIARGMSDLRQFLTLAQSGGG